jgi:hypothetical protein
MAPLSFPGLSREPRIEASAGFAPTVQTPHLWMAGTAVRSWIMNRWPPSKNFSSAPGMRAAMRSWVSGRAMPS